jgi:hypothetical protein
MSNKNCTFSLACYENIDIICGHEKGSHSEPFEMKQAGGDRGKFSARPN